MRLTALRPSALRPPALRPSALRPTALAIAGGLVVAAMLPTRAAAQPACAVGTLASYVALGAAGCTFGGLTFGDFLASSFAGRGSFAAPFDAAVRVTPFARTVAGRPYVGLAMERVGGLEASAADAFAGGTVCAPGFCYLSYASLGAEFRVTGDAFTGAFGLGARTDRALTVAGTDWGAYLVEGIGALTASPVPPPDPLPPSVERKASAGWAAAPEQCLVFGLGDPRDEPCAGPALIATPGVRYARYGVNLGAFVVSDYDRPAAPPGGNAMVTAAGAEYLFGVRAPATTVPEPATLALAGGGALLLGAWARRRTGR